MGAFNFIYLTCKKATYLMSKQEEGKLTPVEKIQLRLHLSVCRFCERFRKQTGLFSGNASHLHEHHDQKMSAAAKEKIKAMLKD